MESNIEVVDQEVEKARAKYGDKDIPPDEIQNFKVSKLVEFHLYHYYPGWFKELYFAKGLISYSNLWILSTYKWCGATFTFSYYPWYKILTKNIDGIAIQRAKVRQIGTVCAAVYIPR